MACLKSVVWPTVCLQSVCPRYVGT
uniref:Uncharacterized protein n=1 Tax=Anguilla anguilla TaxID=7936 RepID=A0A0E9SUC8_ANGAN